MARNLTIWLALLLVTFLTIPPKSVTNELGWPFTKNITQVQIQVSSLQLETLSQGQLAKLKHVFDRQTTTQIPM
jgi:hypothetical protein